MGGPVGCSAAVSGRHWRKRGVQGCYDELFFAIAKTSRCFDALAQGGQQVFCFSFQCWRVAAPPEDGVPNQYGRAPSAAHDYPITIATS